MSLALPPSCPVSLGMLQLGKLREWGQISPVTVVIFILSHRSPKSISKQGGDTDEENGP